MRRLVGRCVLSIVVLAAAWAGLALLRYYQMDRGVRAFKDNNGAAALRHLKPLAYFGDRTAQLLVGWVYAFGLGGVSKNDKKAIYWFHKSGPIWEPIETGVDPAAPVELSVAELYASGGEGVAANRAESLKWLRLAAEGGSKKAAAMLASPTTTSAAAARQRGP